MKWDRGRYALVNAGSFDKAVRESQADRVFLALVDTFNEERRDVSRNPSVTYAPTVFSKHPDAKGFTKDDLRAARDRLLGQKKIEIEQYGKASEPRKRVILAASDAEK